jgi:hypothetical protein
VEDCGGRVVMAVQKRHKSKHPNHGDLYTPWNEELLELLDQMRLELGSWRKVCAASGMRMRQMRYLRSGKRTKAVTMNLVDRLCTTTGVGSIEDFVWFTAWDLVDLGIWKKPAPPYPNDRRTGYGKRKKIERRQAARRRAARDQARKDRAAAFLAEIIAEGHAKRAAQKANNKGDNE